MRKAPLLLLILLLLITLSSCRRDAAFHDALLRAEALMETDPHAARAVLDSLSDHCSLITDHFSQRETALYALLKTQADYKSDIPLTSDSLARIATDYYGTPRRPDYHAAMAWYTLGCVYGDMNDDVNGTEAFLKAKSLFPDTLIRYYALAEQNLGLHYKHRFMKKEAVQELQYAKQNYIRLADSAAVAFVDLCLAQCCLYKKDFASAREVLKCVFCNPYAHDYVIRDAYFELAKVETYASKNYTKALEDIENSILYTTNKKRLAGTYNQKAVIYQEQGRFDSAWYYYHRSLDCYPVYTTFAFNYRQLVLLAPVLGKTDSIHIYIQQHDVYLDSIYIVNNQQSIRQVMNDHRVELEQQRLEGEHRRLVLTLSLAALVLVILVLAVLVWSLNTANQRKRQYIQISDQLKQSQMEEERRKTELVAAKEEAERLKTAYQEARQRVDELESQHEETTSAPKVPLTPQAERTLILFGYENRIRICTNQFRKDLSWVLVQKYLHGSEHSLTKQERIAIRHDLNVCFTDYYEILQTEGKRVNQTEKTVSACYILGLKSEETGEVLDISDDTVRVQKHRLKGKLPADFYEIVFSFRL